MMEDTVPTKPHSATQLVDHGPMDITEMHKETASTVQEESIPDLARSGATFEPPCESTDRPIPFLADQRRNQQEPPGGRGGLDAADFAASHQDMNYRLLQMQNLLVLQREQEVSWLRSKVDELTNMVAEKDMQIIDLDKKLQEERMQRAALLGDFWRNRQPPADFVATPAGQTWNTKWSQGEISLLRAQVEALSKEIRSSRKEMQNSPPKENTLKQQQAEERPGRRTPSQTTEEPDPPISPAPVSCCSSTSSSVVSVTPLLYSKKEAPATEDHTAAPKTPPPFSSFATTTSSPFVVVSATAPSPPVSPTEEEVTAAGGPSKDDGKVEYCISPDKDGPLKGWYCQMDEKRPSSPPATAGDDVQSEKKTGAGKEKPTPPPVATHIKTEQQESSPEGFKMMADSNDDKTESFPSPEDSMKKTDSNDENGIVAKPYNIPGASSTGHMKRPSLSEAMQEVSELTIPSLDHHDDKHDSKGKPILIKSAYTPPAALQNQVVKLAKVEEDLAPSQGHGQTSGDDSSSHDDDSKGQPVKRSPYTPPAALQNQEIEIAKVEEDLAPSHGHGPTGGDDDSSFLGGQSLDSSTFGDNRVRVVNKKLSDPYGDRGVYTGVILRSTEMPHGSGLMVYDDGRTYEGEWRFGRWHRYGRACFTNGDCYEGAYEYDQRNGHGVYRWRDGRVYSGTFRDDKRNGKGTYWWPDGSVYKGDFVNGRREGHGSYKFEDGGAYVGGWKDGLHHGFGTCTWANGRQYRGEWKNGKAHGKGVETYADGTVRHDGLWIDDAPVGAGSAGGDDETKTEDLYDC